MGKFQICFIYKHGYKIFHYRMMNASRILDDDYSTDTCRYNRIFLLMLLVLRYSEYEGDIKLDPLEHDIEDETLDALDGHFDNDDDEDETFDATEPQDNSSSTTIHTEKPGTSSCSKSWLIIFAYFL